MGTVIFRCVIASGASTSSGIDLTKDWQNVSLRVGTMSTGVNIALQNSDDGGVTYYYAFHPPINSATVVCNTFLVSAGVGSGGGIVPLPEHGLNYIRVVGTGVISGGCSFAIICSE